MNAASRISRSLRQHGLATTLHKAIAVAADCYFDVRYGVDTRTCVPLGGLTIAGANRDRGARYQPTRVLPLRRVLRTLRPQFANGSAFVDLGCGKGRILLIAAEFGFKAVRGVEFAHELCAVASANCAAYKRQRRLATEFRVLEEDVVRHAVAYDEDVFFMYNPFEADVLDRVLDNILASVKAWPRRVLIIYHNPRLAPLIEQRREFAPWETYAFDDNTFRVYVNRP
jgi:SAM-dependent methyltransferase